MLQELDQVATRIGQLVEISQQLLAERNRLLQQLETVEGDADGLRQALSDKDAKVTQLSVELDRQSTSLQTENQRLHQQVKALNEQVSVLEKNLSKAETDLSHWKKNAQAIRGRVAHVLENLPMGTA